MSVVGTVAPPNRKGHTSGSAGKKSRWLAPVVVFVLVALLWEVGVYLLNVPVFLLPPPSAIIVAFIANIADLFLYGFHTFRQAIIGFAIGCGLGIIVALITARSKMLSDLLVPLAVASNSVPIVAMAPLAIVWFGIGEGSKIAIVAIMCFFPMLVSTVRGLNSASSSELELLHSYAASEWQLFQKLRVPSALPYVFNAFKICAGLSMIGSIVAEFFGGSVKYLGVYIKTEANILHTTNAWAAILVACLIGIAFYLVLVGLERVAMPWHSSQRMEE